MKSKGISSNIDLTMNSDFRKGVKEYLVDRKYQPSTLPWDSTGKLVVNSTHDLFNNSNINMELINNIFDEYTSDWIMEDLDQDMKLIADWDINNYNTGAIKPIIYKLLEDIKNTSSDINKLSKYMDNIKFYIVDDALMVNDTSIIEWIYSMTYNYDYYCQTLIYDNDVSYINSNNLIDVTPYEYSSIKIPKDEVQGIKLLTGDVELIKHKREKLDYLDKIRKLLPKPIVDNICKSYRQNTSEDINNALILNYTKPRFYNTLRVKFTDCDIHEYKMMGYELTYGIMEKFRKRNTFFDHIKRSDRGVNIIRIPRGSHELRVDLKTQRISDDDSDEIRKSSWYTLTIDRFW